MKRFLQNSEIIYIGIISIVSTVILGISIYFVHIHFEKIVVNQTKEQLLTIAQTSAQNINSSIAGIENDLKLLAINPMIPTYLKTRQDFSEIAKQWLFSIKNTLGRFGAEADVIYMLDLEGKVRSRIPFKENWIGHDYSQKPSVRYVLAHQEPCITEVITDSGIRSIAICVPVFENEKFIGALRSLITFETIGKLLQTIRFGQYGHAELVNIRSREVVYHPGFSSGNSVSTDMVCPQKEWSFDFTKEMSSNKNGVRIYDYNGTLKIIAFSSIEIGTEPWFVFITLPYSEVDEPIHWHGINICVFGGVIVFILGISLTTFYRMKRKKLILKQKTEFYQKSVEQIRNMNNFNEVILASIPLALMIVNENYNVVCVNQTYRSIFNLGKDEFITLDGSYFGKIQNDSIPANSIIGEMLTKLYKNEVEEIKSNEVVTQDKKFCIFVVKLISPKFTLDSASQEESKETQFLVVIEDITEQKKMEEEIRRKEAEVIHATRLASLGEMATGIAHELNQPLTAIMNYGENTLDILEAENKNSARANESLRKIIIQVRRAKNIIQHLRDFARREEDRKYVIFNLQNTLEKTLQFLKPQINLNEIVVETHFAKSSLSILGNELQMEQVFTNIIVNAIDAVNVIDKSERKKIIITTKYDDNISIIIEDNGISFDEESKSKLFDPFFTTKDPGKGTGLGLSISYRIIKEHGGQISAEKLDTGAKFIIVLPISVES